MLRRSHASFVPLRIRFVDEDSASKISAQQFGSLFKGNEAEVAWVPVDKKSNKANQKPSAIDMYVGLGKKPTALSLLKATHAGMTKARAFGLEDVQLVLPKRDLVVFSNVSLTAPLISSSSSTDITNKNKTKNKKDDEAAATLTPDEVAERLSMFAHMSAYSYNRMKTDGGNADAKKQLAYRARVSIMMQQQQQQQHKKNNQHTHNKLTSAAVTRGKIIAESINLARTWQNIRPDVGTPDFYARDALRICKTLRNTRKVAHLRGDALAKKGLHLMHSVGKGSQYPPNLLVLQYRGDPKSKCCALVGKGVVMDTGGLNVKPYGNMESMHMDMGGSAAVFGAFVAAARLGLKTNLVAVLGFVNNAVGSTSYQPSEILRSLKGTTVQIDNTDAEGRLVLADAMTFVQKQNKNKNENKVDTLIDVATLTGAICVALGNERAGLFSNDGALSKDLLRASDRALEPCWPMPIAPEHHKAMKGTLSDLVNCAPGRYGGACSAAAFLENFVEKGVKWSHLDIAGPGIGDKPTDRNPAGATGYGVALLVEYLRRNSKK